MAFDEAQFRAAAKAQGDTDEEIEAFIASRKQAPTPAQPASEPAFGERTQQFVQQGQAQQQAAQQARDVQAGPFTIPDWLTVPLATGAAGAAGYGAKALIDKLRSAPAEVPRVEPTFDMAPPPAAAPQVDPIQEAKLRQEQAKAALQEFKLEQAKQGKAAVPAPTPAAPAAPPAAPAAPTQTPANIAQVQQQAAEALAARQAAPVAAPVAPAAPAAPVAAAPVPPPAVTPPPVTPADVAPVENTPPAKKAVEKKPREKLTFKSATELPAGTTFRPDLGTGDKWLINTTGPERRKLILNEFNQGKPAGSYEQGQKLYQQYLEKYPKENFGPVIPKEEAQARGIKPPEPFGGWGKAVKVAGTAGVLLTAAELAQAAQKAQKDKGAALKELAFNAMGMIPGLGTAFNAMTFSGGLNTNEEKELARLRGVPPPVRR